mmetsp:Transcript_8685/g.36198  ORF Transcript_8685/g.36198 Transcript_8685/m.36198 type:complete len:207 (+) Transcript_8685:115-735(+)
MKASTTPSVTWLRACWCASTRRVSSAMSSFFTSPVSSAPDAYFWRISSSFSSSSRKKVRYWKETSTSTLAPNLRCSSTVSRPPEKAWRLILFAICFGVSVRKTAEVPTLALIFVLWPWRAGKNLEWINAGFSWPSLGATSRVIRKYGSWSMAQGMRHCMSVRPLNRIGKAEGKLGAAWMAGKENFPMLSLSTNPKIPFTCEPVTAF